MPHFQWIRKRYGLGVLCGCGALLIVPFISCRPRPLVISEDDLFRLAPAEVAFVLQADFTQLRDAKVWSNTQTSFRLPSPQRLGRVLTGLPIEIPWRRVTLGLAGSKAPEGQMDFLLLADLDQRAEVFFQRIQSSGIPLKTNSHHGGEHVCTPFCCFAKAGERRILSISTRWSSGFWRRFDQGGLGLLRGNPVMAPLIQSFKGRHSAWMVGHLSPAFGGYLARESGWGELNHLRTFGLGIIAAETLSLHAMAQMQNGEAAGALRERINQLALGTAPHGEKRIWSSAGKNRLLGRQLGIQVLSLGRILHLDLRVNRSQIGSIIKGFYLKP